MADDKSALVKAELEAEVERLGKVYRVKAPIESTVKALRDVGADELISLRDLAYARVSEGNESTLSEEGSQVREGALYVRRGPVLLVSDSPIVKKSETGREKPDFYLTVNEYRGFAELGKQERRREPQEREVFLLKQRGTFSIPIDRFGEEELTLWAFKDQAENYGELLGSCGLKVMTVSVFDGKTVKQALQGSDYSHLVYQMYLSQIGASAGVYGYGATVLLPSEFREFRGVVKQ